MKLALYSGGSQEQNHEMNKVVFQLVNDSKQEILPYVTIPKGKIPYAQGWVTNYIAPYTKVSPRALIIDEQLTTESIEVLTTTKILLITGGNTFLFLQAMRRYGADTYINDFIKRGGLLIGFSAGAMLMTPTIALAAFPSYEADSNPDKLEELTALNVVNYEIMPHYSNTLQFDSELLAYSRTNNRPIYALEDGAGILHLNNRESLYGNITLFNNGEKAKITCS